MVGDHRLAAIVNSALWQAFDDVRQQNETDTMMILAAVHAFVMKRKGLKVMPPEWERCHRAGRKPKGGNNG